MLIIVGKNTAQVKQLAYVSCGAAWHLRIGQVFSSQLRTSSLGVPIKLELATLTNTITMAIIKQLLPQ